MKNLLFLFILLFPGFCCLFAQEPSELITQNLYRDIAISGSHDGIPYYGLNQGKSSAIAGSVYMDENYEEGLILDKSNKKFRINGRYNVETDQIQIIIDDEQRVIFPEKVNAVLLGDKIFVPTSFEESDKTFSRGFFELLVEGPSNLYLRRTVSIAQTGNASIPGVGKTDETKYVINENYFYSFNNKPAKKLKKGKKNVLEVLKLRKAKVKDYAMKNNLSFRSTEGLIGIFNYYNSLNASKGD